MSRRQRRSRVNVGAAPAADTAGELQDRGRIGGIDALRGVALCLMFVYHFAFDLRFYRVSGRRQSAESPPTLLWRWRRIVHRARRNASPGP